jgi:hypothetical protein
LNRRSAKPTLGRATSHNIAGPYLRLIGPMIGLSIDALASARDSRTARARYHRPSQSIFDPSRAVRRSDARIEATGDDSLGASSATVSSTMAG